MRNPWTLSLFLLAAPLAGCVGQAGTVGSQNSALGSLDSVVIAQIYGGGENATETLRSDYIVLYNGSSTAQSLSGFSIYYSPATSTYAEVALTGSIPAGGAYLVAGASGTTGTELPTPDLTTDFSILESKGQIALTTSSTAVITPLTCVDFVGWGTGTATYATTSPAPAMSNSTALVRNVTSGGACTDTQQNSNDFTLADLTSTTLPPNSHATITSCASNEPATVDMLAADDLRSAGSANDLATSVHGDGGVASEPTGNQPDDNNGNAPTYKPGASIPGAFGVGSGRGFNGCTIGGNAAPTPWLAGLLVVGALAFRRRRTA